MPSQIENWSVRPRPIRDRVSRHCAWSAMLAMRPVRCGKYTDAVRVVAAICEQPCALAVPEAREYLVPAWRTNFQPALLQRKKVGFKVPFGEWVRGAYRAFACDALLVKLRSFRGSSTKQSWAEFYGSISKDGRTMNSSLVTYQPRSLPAHNQAYGSFPRNFAQQRREAACHRWGWRRL